VSTDKNMFSRSKNKMNKPLLALVSISACAVAALSLAPTVLSTRWGTNYLCKLINKTTQGTLQIQSLSLSWFGDQSIEGINFSDAKQTYYASCQSINSNSSLISILSSKDFGDMTLVSPHLKVKKDISKTNKIQGTPIKKGSLLFIPVANPDMKNLLFSMQGRILVKEGTIDVLTVAIDPITISDIQSTIFISKESSNLSVFLKAVTTQGMQKGTMSLSSVLKNVDTFDSEISINAALTNLPTRGLDQVAALINPSLKNSLEKTLGGNLT